MRFILSEFLCSYCGKLKPESERTGEHVIPKGLGGAVSPVNPFLLKTVCETCNKVCGLFVDGPFLKNSLVHGWSAQAFRQFTALDANIGMPLNYMGFLDWPDAVPDGLVCEIWLGPTGDQIFHFHKPYPEIPGTLGMIKPATIRGIDPGFAVVFIRATNPEWHKVIYHSITRHFSTETKLYFGNANAVGRFQSPDDETLALIRTIRDRFDLEKGNLKLQFSMDMGFAERFQAKLCLGFGSLFFDIKYLESSYAKFLRDYLWTKTTMEREAMPLRGKGIFTETNDPISSMVGHESLITVMLMPNPVGVGLFVDLYKKQNLFVLATDDLSHWPKHLPEEGIAFAIAPSLGKAVGPLSAIQLIASLHRQIPNSQVQKILDELDAEKKVHPKYNL